MRETATLGKINAMYEAFSEERLRWLIGKGDLLVQKGDLDEEHLQELIKKTVKEEYERHLIIDALKLGFHTVSKISEITTLEPYLVFSNIRALCKWKQVVAVEQQGQEYVYALAEEIS